MSTFQLERHLGPLVPYTRKFAALIGAGVSLARTLELLQQTTDDPAVAAAAATLSQKVQAGQTLSATMAALPEVFSPFYIAFVRAGEVGGVLDDTLAELADWLEQEWQAGERLRTRALLAQLAAKVMGDSAGLAGEAELAAALETCRQKARVSSFCRLWERCLSAGVPMKLALATAAGVLEEPAAGQVRQAAEELGRDEAMGPRLAQIAELRPVVARMVTIGEETGSLELMLRKAAQFVQAEAAYALHRPPAIMDY